MGECTVLIFGTGKKWNINISDSVCSGGRSSIRVKYLQKKECSNETTQIEWQSTIHKKWIKLSNKMNDYWSLLLLNQFNSIQFNLLFLWMYLNEIFFFSSTSTKSFRSQCGCNWMQTNFKDSNSFFFKYLTMIIILID